MRKVSAAITLVIMSCSCASASISREVVETAWHKMAAADGFPELPVNYVQSNEPNAAVQYMPRSEYRIYVTTGLIRILNSEGEMAAVWGHEIGHVRLDHLVNDINRAEIWKTTEELLSNLEGVEGEIARQTSKLGADYIEAQFKQ